MSVDELKKNLHDVIERYNNKTEFCGEIRRDDMARDCLQVIENLEAENERLKGELDAKTMYAEARNDDARMYAEEIRNMNENFDLLETENERLKGAIKVMHTECDTCWKVQELRKENAKLHCLALHLFERVAFHEFNEWSEILDELREKSSKRSGVKKACERWYRIYTRCGRDYRKEKQELREGK